MQMFIRPDDSALTPTGIDGFEADFTVINACEIVNENWEEHGLNSEVFVALSVEKKVQLIGGTFCKRKHELACASAFCRSLRGDAFCSQTAAR